MTAFSLASAKSTKAMVQRRQQQSDPLHWRVMPGHPPYKNVISADHSLTPACHFGGKCANYAQSANPVNQKAVSIPIISDNER